MDNFWNEVSTQVNNSLEQGIQEGQKEISVLEDQKKNAVPQKRLVTTSKFGFEIKTEEVAEISVVTKKIDANISLIQSDILRKQSIISGQAAFALELAEKGFADAVAIPTELFNAVCSKFDLYRFERIAGNGKTQAKSIFGVKDRIKLMSGFESLFLSWLPAIFLFAFGMSLYIPFLLVTYAVASYASTIRENKEITKNERRYWVANLFMALLTAPLFLDIFFRGDAYWTYTYPLASIPLALLCGWAASWVSWVVSLLTTIGIMYVFGISEDAETEMIKKLASKVYGLWIRMLPQKLLVRLLWPEKIDTYRIKEGEDVSIRFPKAPQPFLDALVRAEQLRMKICVAAVPEAIIVNREEIRQNINKRIDETKWDPILYTKSDDNSQVGILGKFGNFPNEETAMKWVRKNGLSVVLN